MVRRRSCGWRQIYNLGHLGEGAIQSNWMDDVGHAGAFSAMVGGDRGK